MASDTLRAAVANALTHSGAGILSSPVRFFGLLADSVDPSLREMLVLQAFGDDDYLRFFEDALSEASRTRVYEPLLMASRRGERYFHIVCGVDQVLATSISASMADGIADYLGIVPTQRRTVAVGPDMGTQTVQVEPSDWGDAVAGPQNGPDQGMGTGPVWPGHDQTPGTGHGQVAGVGSVTAKGRGPSPVAIALVMLAVAFASFLAVRQVIASREGSGSASEGSTTSGELSTVGDEGAPDAGDEGDPDPDAPRLDDATDARKVNTFLSNFTESGFLDRGLGTSFDRDGTSLEMVTDLVFSHCALNGGSLERVTDSSLGNTRLGTDHLDYDANYLFGRTYDWSKVGGQAYSHADGFVYTVHDGAWAHRGPAVATSVEHVDTNRYRVRFDAYYQELSYDVGALWPYATPIPELSERLGVSGPNRSGTAIVHATRGSDGLSLTLESMELD